MLRLFTFLIVLLAVCGSASGQYAFESKKAEKLYTKLEEYYANYDYEAILGREPDIQTFYLDKQDTLAALMYSFLGEAYLMARSDVKTSLDHYRKELEIRTAIQPDKDISDLILNIASLQNELGYFAESEKLFLQVLKSDEEKYGKKSTKYIRTALFYLVDHYTLTEETGKALEVIKGLKIEKNTYEDAMAHNFMGVCYDLMGYYSKAEKHLQKALKILSDAGMYPSFDYVFVLNNLGTLYLNTSSLPMAEEVFLTVESLLDRIEGATPEDYNTLKSNQGQLYFELGDYTRAAELYQKLLEEDRAFYGEGSFNTGLSAYSLALTYMYAGKYDQSEKYHLMAMDIFRNISGKKSHYARVLNNLAYIYTKRGELESATKYGEQAIEEYRNIFGESHPETAFAYFNIGKVYETIGASDQAKEYLEKSLKIRKSLLGEQHPFYAQSTNQLAILNWELQDINTALDYYQETFGNYFRQINSFFPILSEDEKVKFYYNNLKPAFEQFNSFIVETSSENRKLIGEMYNYQLATKGLIFYATNKVRTSIRNSGDSVLIEKYNTWIGQKEQLARLFSAADMPLEERNKKIDSLNEVANALEKELSKASSVFEETFASRKLTWQDVRDQLNPGEAAVEIVRFRDFAPQKGGQFTDEVYYAALIVTSETTDYPDMVLMRNGKLMETKYLSNYRNAIKYQVNEDYSYRLFWKPIANKLEGIKRVYFSPDGVFNQISLNTLRNPDTGNFLLDEIEIRLIKNTKDLLASKDKDGSDNPSFLFGYPNYNMGTLEEENKTEPAAEEGSEDRGGVRGARGARNAGGADIAALTREGSIPRGLRGNLLRYMRSNQALALLPGTKKEVNLIDSLYAERSQETVTYLSNEALEGNIKKAKNPRTLHIATHGFFLENTREHDTETDEYVENPLLRSGLILAGANSFISSGKISEEKNFVEDGILTAFEAMNLNLDETELVVLSACETGLGEVKNGEGVFGLQRAFQVAGADAVIMSMWTVDDNATQELMTRFYEEWLSGSDKNTAFVNAQRKIKDKWKAPYYWGAFVIIGQ